MGFTTQWTSSWAGAESQEIHIEELLKKEAADVPGKGRRGRDCTRTDVPIARCCTEQEVMKA